MYSTKEKFSSSNILIFIPLDSCRSLIGTGVENLNKETQEIKSDRHGEETQNVNYSRLLRHDVSCLIDLV